LNVTPGLPAAPNSRERDADRSQVIDVNPKWWLPQ